MSLRGLNFLSHINSADAFLLGLNSVYPINKRDLLSYVITTSYAIIFYIHISNYTYILSCKRGVKLRILVRFCLHKWLIILIFCGNCEFDLNNKASHYLLLSYPKVPDRNFIFQTRVFFYKRSLNSLVDKDPDCQFTYFPCHSSLSLV